MRSIINLNHGDCMEAMAEMADNRKRTGARVRHVSGQFYVFIDTK